LKRQQLEKIIGKKITGGYGKAPRGKASGSPSGKHGAATDASRQPMAVRLIKGLEKK
jgi:hypothetical protein